MAVFVTVGSLVALLVLAVVLAVRSEPGWPVLTYMLAFTLGQVAILVAGRRAFANPSRRRSRRIPGSPLALPCEDERGRARALLESRGTPNRLAWMTTWPENRWFCAEARRRGTWPTACTPAWRSASATRWPPRRRTASAARGVRRPGRAGRARCPACSPSPRRPRPAAAGLGWHALQVAEEAVIDLPTLTFKGKAWQDVRTALNQAAKQGITSRLGPARRASRAGSRCRSRRSRPSGSRTRACPRWASPSAASTRRSTRTCASGWPSTPTATVHGVTSWMPIHGTGGGSPSGWTLDVMRRLPGGFRYSMEFLIASACLAFRDEGCRVVSLSGAPLGRGRTGGLRTSTAAPLDAFLDRLGATLEPLLRLPVAARVQVEVPAAARAAVPRLPRRSRAAPDRRRAQPRLPARGRAA